MYVRSTQKLGTYLNCFMFYEKPINRGIQYKIVLRVPYSNKAKYKINNLFITVNIVKQA